MNKFLKNISYIAIFFIGILMNTSFASGTLANAPVVVPGLTPVKYSGGNWIPTTNMDQEWYDYENGVWANAKTNNGYQYVWIPRFTYKIDGEDISIKWSNGKNDDTSEGYLRHPAFYFGEYTGGSTLDDVNFIERNSVRNELTGFWIQKDLFSSNVTDVSGDFENAIKITQDTAYGLPQSGTYTHMTKASEWGALAYLTAAKGFFYDNKTTLDQTGVNLGLVSEYVAGIKGNPSSNILNLEYKKYKDSLNGAIGNYYGYALTETQNLANSSGELLDDSFLIRGGYLGLFGYSSGNGKTSGNGYRTSISVIPEELTEKISLFDTEASVVSGDYLILGVDFYVQEAWSFPAEPSDFFTALGNIENKKVVDMECIYGGLSTWHQKDLNAQVIKMIKPDFSVEDVSEISSSKEYLPGKYTLVVRIGGKDYLGDPIFKAMSDMDVKIVINQLTLKNSAKELIKIGNIQNNKVRLNVYGESGSSVISKVVLKKAPTKLNYDLEEELDFNGGILVPYLGTLAGEEMAITMENVVVDDITSQSGENILVDLVYDGLPVIQGEEEYNQKFIINVSNIRQLIVNGETKAGNNIINSQFKGPGKYSRGDTDRTQDLVTLEYLSGYLFNNWESDSNYVKAANSNNFNTKFTIPKKSTSIDNNEITITANYIAPDRLEIENPQTEFTIGEDFSLGQGILTAVYKKNSEIKRQISLGTSGVTATIMDDYGNTYKLDDLQVGIYTVRIDFVGASVEYLIEVIGSKYSLNVYTSQTEFGEISGQIKDIKNAVKDTIEISGDNTSVYKYVPSGRTVTLTAIEKAGYAFSKWKVTNNENLISQINIYSKEITFRMPSSDVTIEGEFVKEYTITFKVANGQETFGKLEGQTTQVVAEGNTSTAVIASPNTGYAFIRWEDSEGRLISNNKKLIVPYITKPEQYTAVFTEEWTVEFYALETLVESIKVKNGENAYSYIANLVVTEPVGQVFIGWDKETELTSVISDIKTNAIYDYRIKIEENPNPEVDKVEARISVGALKDTSPAIKEGTLKYLITASSQTPNDCYYTYKEDGVFTGIEGDWYNENDYYRSLAVASGEDSSSLITISSVSKTEILEFEYILSATSDSQLGITINGERVIGPDKAISEGWNSFKKEVDVINGEIKIGLSYSQGDGSNVKNDFAAIRNLFVVRNWIDIPNTYYLLADVEYDYNYVHVKGIGSDDGIEYTAVSDVFARAGAELAKYSVTFNSNGGSGSMSPQIFTEGVSQELSENKFTKHGCTFIGWSTVPGGNVQYVDKQSYMITEDVTLYAVWNSPTAILYSDGTMVFQNNVISDSSKVVTATYTGWDTATYSSVSETPWYNNISDIKNVVINDNVALIDISYWFLNASNLRSAYIGKGVTSIGTATFRACSNLASVTLPSTLKTIERNAFFDCDGLTDISIPDGVTEIGEFAFYSCQNLGGTLIIPDSVNTIGNYAFVATKFTGIETGIGLETIGEFAFWNCDSLTNATIYGNKTNIGYAAFYECSNLKNVTLSNGVAIIGEASFQECSSLTNITIPNSVTEIKGYAFGSCENLVSITFEHGVDDIISLPTAGSGYGAFYARSVVVTNIISANAIINNYDWAADNRTLGGIIVTFDSNNGTGDKVAQTFSKGVIQNLKLNTFEREGYVFKGWSTTANGQVKYTDGASYTATGNITLYAVWEKVSIETIPLSEIPVGAYIAYNPVHYKNGEKVTTVTVKGTDVGVLQSDNVTGIDQTFNIDPEAGGYNSGWKVLYNDGNQLTLISAESVGNLELGTETSVVITSETDERLNGAKIGYAKAIGTLNNMCSEYAKGEYAVSGRSVGYGGTTPGPDEIPLDDISDAKLKEHALNNNYSIGYPYIDTYNAAETNFINDTTEDGKYVLRHSGDPIWIASRGAAFGESLTFSSFHVRVLTETPTLDWVNGYLLYEGDSDELVSGEVGAATRGFSPSAGVRPVITLESGLKVIKDENDGTTSAKAYILTR